MDKTIILDCREMKTVRGTHRYLAGKLGFPGYYGGNLDALYDCLCELPSGTLIAFEHSGALRWNLGDYGKRLMKTFEDASAAGFLKIETV